MDKELKPKAKGKLASGEDGNTGISVIFGIMFDFKGTPITVSLSDLNKAVKEGFEFTLPKPLELGTFSELLHWLDQTFKTEILEDTLGDEAIKKLPSPFNQIAGKIEDDMVFSITMCHIKIPGTDPWKTVSFTEGKDWAKDDDVLDFAKAQVSVPDAAKAEKENGDWDIKVEDNILYQLKKKNGQGAGEAIDVDIYDKRKLYTFQMQGKLREGIPLVESLQFDGFAFGVTNEQSKL